MPISFIYFDLDDTILDHRRAEKLALKDVYEEYADSIGTGDFHVMHDAYREINGAVWRAYSDGDLDKEGAKYTRFKRLLDRFNSDSTVDPDTLSDCYLRHYSKYWTSISGAEEAIQELHRNFQLGILTNGFSEIQHRKLDQFPTVKNACSTVVVSDEIGSMKPNPEIFTHATALANCERSQILYVGDSLRSDVHGGLAAGWQVAWFTNEPSDEPNVFRFHRWPDLVSWLDPTRIAG